MAFRGGGGLGGDQHRPPYYGRGGGATPYQPAPASYHPAGAPSPAPGAYARTPVTIRAPPSSPSSASSPTPAPSSLLATAAALAPTAAVASAAVAAAAVPGVAAVSSDVELAPVSSKGLAQPARPGHGTQGKAVMIRANHFLVNIDNNNIFHYDVAINPESKSRQTNRDVLNDLIKLHGKTSLGGKLPAYDGRKSLYTAGSLPFESEEFVVKLVDPEKKYKEKAEREYKITIGIAGRTDLYHLQLFLRGRQRDMPQETIQVLDVVLRESPSWNYVRSFFSTDFSHRGDIGEGLECWRGYYQSFRPTQTGLSLNIDISATSFFKPVTVIQFVEEFLNLRNISRPLSDRDRVKIKKALRGVSIETNHQQDQIRRYKITGITPILMSQLIFPIDDEGMRMTVLQYFWERYDEGKHTPWPCLQSVSDSRPVYLPMEVCKIVEGQRYSKKLNDKQVTNILRATCQRPQQREESICKMVMHNMYEEDRFAQEIGIKVVASMDWPEITKHRGLVSAQPHRQEIIEVLFSVSKDPHKGTTQNGGMIRELLISFRRKTGRSPERIIFYRDGVSEGQFTHVLLHEMDAIRKACASLEEGYLPPVTSVVVQKRHRTRLFPEVHGRRDMTDKSGKLLPGTVVDLQICHPTEFDFYLCSHAGIQGTRRQTHYDVLYDENYFIADTLQILTNNLCYTYARCTRAVSVVPRAYYAHLAVFCARYNLEGDSSDGRLTPGNSGHAVAREGPEEDLQYTENTNKRAALMDANLLPKFQFTRDTDDCTKFNKDTYKNDLLRINQMHQAMIYFEVEVLKVYLWCLHSQITPERSNEFVDVRKNLKNKMFVGRKAEESYNNNCVQSAQDEQLKAEESYNNNCVQSAQDEQLKTQIFLKLLGKTLSLQPVSTEPLRCAVQQAFSKHKLSIKDCYIIYQGKKLDMDKTLVSHNIKCNSTLEVRFRMRGGVNPLGLEDLINTLSHDQLFEEWLCPQILLGLNGLKADRDVLGLEFSLADRGRMIFRKLFDMISALHGNKISLNGMFTYHNIVYYPLIDCFGIDSEYLEANKVDISSETYEADINSLSQVFEMICQKHKKGRGYTLLANMDHLINAMRSFPPSAIYMDSFKIFIRNHPALLSLTELVSLVLEVKTYLVYQDALFMARFVELAGVFTLWDTSIQSEGPMHDAFVYQTYDNNSFLQWFELVRNFVRHPAEIGKPPFSMEEAILAVIVIWDNKLAEFFLKLATNQLPSRHEIAIVFRKDCAPLPIPIEWHLRQRLPNNRRVYLNIEIGFKQAGMITIELFDDIAPDTCANFRRYCRMPKPRYHTPGYRYSPFHIVRKGVGITGGGDFQGDGELLEDENFLAKHTGPGLLSMAATMDTNFCQFFITCQANKSWDNRYVVFGRVSKGYSIVEKIAEMDADYRGRPTQICRISSCGVLPT